MALRPFAALTLPARDTVFGSLSMRGAHVELMAHPERDDRFGACWAVAFEIKADDPALLQEGREALAGLHAVLASDLLEGDTWRGVGWIPVQNVASRAFRLLWDPDLDVAPAWVVMEDGVAQVRLRPNASSDPEEFVIDVRDHLQNRSLQSEVRLIPLDAVEYQRHLERLQWLGGTIAAPQSLS